MDTSAWEFPQIWAFTSKQHPPGSDPIAFQVLGRVFHHWDDGRAFQGFQGLGIPLSSFQEFQHRVQHPPIPTFPLGFVQIHPKQKEGVGKGGQGGGNHLENVEYWPNIP